MMKSNLIPRMTYFITIFHLMAVSVLTTVNFWKFNNLYTIRSWEFEA